MIEILKKVVMTSDLSECISKFQGKVFNNFVKLHGNTLK